jgi:hypothetical protein
MKPLLRTYARNSKNRIDYFESIKKSGKFDLNDPKVFNDVLEVYYEEVESKKSKNTSPTSIGSTDKGQSYENTPKVVSGLADMMERLLSAEDTRTMPSIEAQTTSVKGLFDMLFSSQGKFNYLSTIGNQLVDKLVGSLEVYAQQQSALLKIINEDAGLTGDYARDFRDALTDANPRLIQLGIGFDELAYAARKSVDESGKFATTNTETWERAGEVAKLFVGSLDTLVSMYPEFAKVGLGAADAQQRIAKAGRDAIGLGLQAQKVTKDLSANLGRINEYGFKNGVDGLSAMVRKSIEFRASMDSVFAIAEKVFSPEGAIDLAANLQVLGGAIGDFNDPLKLMYMATNNVEGLQDALHGAASTLATYNEKQGRFEVTGANLRRAKEMATAMGISMKELTNISVASAERTAASTALMAKGFVLDESQKEFITNIAQMKGGRMVIQVGASPELKKEFGKSEVAIEDLTQKQIAQIMQYQDQLKELSEEEIIRQQATDVTQIRRNFDAMLAAGAKVGGRAIKGVAEETMQQLTGLSSKDLVNMTGNMARDFSKAVESFDAKVIGNNKDMFETFKGFINDTWGKISSKFELPQTGKKEEKPDLKVSMSDADKNNEKAYRDVTLESSKATADNTGAMVKLQSTANQTNRPTQGNANEVLMASAKPENKNEKTDKNVIINQTTMIPDNYTTFVSLVQNQNSLITKMTETLQSIDRNYEKNILYAKNEINQDVTPKSVIIKESNQPKDNYVTFASLIDNQNSIVNKLTDLYQTLNKTPNPQVEQTKESLVKEVKITHLHEFRAQNGVIDPVARAIMISPEFTQFFVKDMEYTSIAKI